MAKILNNIDINS